MPDERLEQLLDLYEARIAEGNPVDTAELCRDSPELLEPLRERLNQLQRFQAAWCLPDHSTCDDVTIAKTSCRLRTSEHSLTATSRFVLERLLASGGLGDVFVAHDAAVDRKVAIKFLRADNRDLREMNLRFSREARITGRLDHPGVAPVFALGIDADQLPFYAMRLVGGRTLQSHIADLHGPEVSKTAFLSGQRRLLLHFVAACKTVAYAHSKGIIHRDLKPMNIMLGEYGETVLVDWGLAKEIDDPFAESEDAASVEDSVADHDQNDGPSEIEFRTNQGTIVGTPGYMSPEQSRGEANSATESSDIYSLGSVLFTILTGEPVFAGSPKFESLRRTAIGDVPRPASVKSGVPQPLEAVCLKAMAFAPKDRYRSAIELAQDVERFLADEPVRARKETTVEWASRMLRRHRQLALFGGLASVFTTLLLVTGLLLLSGEKNRTAQARDSALANLDTAVSAINDLYTEISENDLLHEPGAEELRKRLLGKALIYYQLLRQQAHASPKLELSAAQATFRVAEITASIDSPEQALPIYEQSIQELEKIHEGSPNSGTTELLVTAYNGLAQTRFELQQFDKAGAWFDKSLELLRPGGNLPQAAATEQLSLLAGTWNSRGSNFLSQGKMPEAVSDFDAAAAILDSLVQTQPLKARLLKALAANRSNRAVAFRLLGQSDKVVAMYQAALEAYQKAANLDPNDAESRNGLATTEYNLANYLTATGDQESALSRYEFARKTWEQLGLDFPLRVTFRIRLAKAFLNQGIVQARLGRAGEAEQTFRETLDRYQRIRAQYPELLDSAVDLAQTYQNLANVIAGDALERDPKRAIEHYDQSISLAEEYLRQDPPPAIRTRLQELLQDSRRYRDDCANAQPPS